MDPVMLQNLMRQQQLTGGNTQATNPFGTPQPHPGQGGAIVGGGSGGGPSQGSAGGAPPSLGGFQPAQPGMSSLPGMSTTATMYPPNGGSWGQNGNPLSPGGGGTFPGPSGGIMAHPLPMQPPGGGGVASMGGMSGGAGPYLGGPSGGGQFNMPQMPAWMQKQGMNDQQAVTWAGQNPNSPYAQNMQHALGNQIQPGAIDHAAPPNLAIQGMATAMGGGAGRPNDQVGVPQSNPGLATPSGVVSGAKPPVASTMPARVSGLKPLQPPQVGGMPAPAGGKPVASPMPVRSMPMGGAMRPPSAKPMPAGRPSATSTLPPAPDSPAFASATDAYNQASNPQVKSNPGKARKPVQRG